MDINTLANSRMGKSMDGVHTLPRMATNTGKCKGERHGQGSYTFANGDKYIGQFARGKRWSGTYIFTNGDKYIGVQDGSAMAREHSHLEKVKLGSNDYYPDLGKPGFWLVNSKLV